MMHFHDEEDEDINIDISPAEQRMFAIGSVVVVILIIVGLAYCLG